MAEPGRNRHDFVWSAVAELLSVVRCLATGRYKRTADYRVVRRSRQQSTHFDHPSRVLAQLITDEQRKSIRADVQKVIAEPFSGTVAQGVILVFAREMNELSFGQNQRPVQISVLGAGARNDWVTTVLAAVVFPVAVISDPVAAVF